MQIAEYCIAKRSRIRKYARCDTRICVCQSPSEDGCRAARASNVSTMTGLLFTSGLQSDWQENAVGRGRVEGDATQIDAKKPENMADRPTCMYRCSGSMPHGQWRPISN